MWSPAAIKNGVCPHLSCSSALIQVVCSEIQTGFLDTKVDDIFPRKQILFAYTDKILGEEEGGEGGA